MIKRVGLGLCLIIFGLYADPPNAVSASAKKKSLCGLATGAERCLSAADVSDCPGGRRNFATKDCMCAPSGVCPESN